MPQLRAPERRTWADDVRPLHLVSHVSRTTPTRDAMAMLWDGSPKVDGHALSGKRVMHQQFLGVITPSHRKKCPTCDPFKAGANNAGIP